MDDNEMGTAVAPFPTAFIHFQTPPTPPAIVRVHGFIKTKLKFEEE